MSLIKSRELMVLSTIRAHPLHGYALAEALEQGIGGALGLKRPAVYAILGRFIERGWVRTTADRQGPYPERQICSLTPQGEQAYPILLRKCLDGSDGSILPLVVQLAHLDDLDLEERRALLLEVRDRRQARLEQLRAFAPHEGAAGAALDLMRRHLEADLHVVLGLLEPRDSKNP